jgi:hypothetical protein
MRWLAVAVMGALAAPAWALDAAQLVEKNIEARGGIDAIRAISSLTSSGTMSW